MEFSVKAVARRNSGVPASLWASLNHADSPRSPSNSIKSATAISAPCCAVANWKANRQTLLLHHVPNVLSERILLIGCGKERELDERQYKQVIQKTINTLNDTGSMEAVCFLTELHVKGRNTYWKVRQPSKPQKRASTALIS